MCGGAHQPVALPRKKSCRSSSISRVRDSAAWVSLHVRDERNVATPPGPVGVTVKGKDRASIALALGIDDVLRLLAQGRARLRRSTPEDRPRNDRCFASSNCKIRSRRYPFLCRAVLGEYDRSSLILTPCQLTGSSSRLVLAARRITDSRSEFSEGFRFAQLPTLSCAYNQS